MGHRLRELARLLGRGRRHVTLLPHQRKGTHGPAPRAHCEARPAGRSAARGSAVLPAERNKHLQQDHRPGNTRAERREDGALREGPAAAADAVRAPVIRPVSRAEWDALATR